MCAYRDIDIEIYSHTRTRTRTHPRARAHTHTHTHTQVARAVAAAADTFHTLPHDDVRAARVIVGLHLDVLVDFHRYIYVCTS